VANVDKGALLFYRVKNKKASRPGNLEARFKKGLVLHKKEVLSW
jgi:hypothetical protein